MIIHNIAYSPIGVRVQHDSPVRFPDALVRIERYIERCIECAHSRARSALQEANKVASKTYPIAHRHFYLPPNFALMPRILSLLSKTVSLGNTSACTGRTVAAYWQIREHFSLSKLLIVLIVLIVALLTSIVTSLATSIVTWSYYFQPNSDKHHRF